MRHTPCGCCPPDRAGGAEVFRALRVLRGPYPEDAGGFFASGGREEAIQPLFLCAAKKKPLAVKRKRQRGICVGTNSTSLAPPQAAGLVRFVVPPFPTRIASLDSRGIPFFGIPLKRPRKRQFLFLESISSQKLRIVAMSRRRADRVVRPYVRSDTSRLPYVKYSTGANVTTRTLYRAMQKPDSTVARQGVH